MKTRIISGAVMVAILAAIIYAALYLHIPFILTAFLTLLSAIATFEMFSSTKIVKNKIAPPFKQAEFDIMYGEGISHEGCLVDLGAELDIINKSGAWYSYGDIRLGQGKEKVKDFLRENAEIAKEIETKIRNVTVAKIGAEAVEDSVDAE